MLMKITPAAEPLDFVRACIAPQNLPTFDLLVGTISIPLIGANCPLHILGFNVQRGTMCLELGYSKIVHSSQQHICSSREQTCTAGATGCRCHNN